jgi:hypothetical protein
LIIESRISEFKGITKKQIYEIALCSELLTKYCSGDQIEKNEMCRACSMYGERRGVYRVLVEKPEGKRPLGRPMHSWEDNINMDLEEVEWGAWTGLIWLRIGTGGGNL